MRRKNKSGNWKKKYSNELEEKELLTKEDVAEISIRFALAELNYIAECSADPKTRTLIRERVSQLKSLINNKK